MVQESRPPRDTGKSSGGSTPSSRQPVPAPQAAPAFDKERFHTDLQATLKELGCSHDVDAALEQLKFFNVPADRQATELCKLLESICEGPASARQVGFKLMARLYLEKEKGCWK